MREALKLVTVRSKYCEFLREYDCRVSINSNEKVARPFVGVLFEINNIEYFAPLSSPKLKHKKMKNTVDFYKIDGGNLGAINFNNMIPVPVSEYTYIDLNKITFKKEDKDYQELLRKQLTWLNSNKHKLKNKALILYRKRMNSELPKSIEKRCCDYGLLEEKYYLYIK